METAGTADRWAMISSALSGLEFFKNFLGIEASPAMSRVKRSVDSFSAITPLWTRSIMFSGGGVNGYLTL
jgi:hypothetical protein